jgi:hypothetical protein
LFVSYKSDATEDVEPFTKFTNMTNYPNIKDELRHPIMMVKAAAVKGV